MHYLAPTARPQTAAPPPLSLSWLTFVALLLAAAVNLPYLHRTLHPFFCLLLRRVPTLSSLLSKGPPPVSCLAERGRAPLHHPNPLERPPCAPCRAAVSCRFRFCFCPALPPAVRRGVSGTPSCPCSSSVVAPAFQPPFRSDHLSILLCVRPTCPLPSSPPQTLSRVSLRLAAICRSGALLCDLIRSPVSPVY